MSTDTALRTRPAPLLSERDPDPVGFVDRESQSPFVVICDHAGNLIPQVLGDLGLPPAELGRHIGIDIGALAVAERVASGLDAPLIFQRYSRLVIDCNRIPRAPDSMAEVADGTLVPGNQGLDERARRLRQTEILEPYHRQITSILDARAAAGRRTLLISIHSFTPSLRTRPADRPWQVGLCWHRDDRLSRLVVEELRREAELNVGENEPYSVNMEVDYSIPFHGERRGIPYVEFEVRQDLLPDASAAEAWAARLTRVLLAAVDRLPA